MSTIPVLNKSLFTSLAECKTQSSNDDIQSIKGDGNDKKCNSTSLSKKPRLNITTPVNIFTLNTNKNDKTTKKFMSDDEISIDEGLSESTSNAHVIKSKNKPAKKQMNYDIDEIIEEENLENEMSNLLPPNRVINKRNKYSKKVNDIDDLLNEIDNETEINHLSYNSNDDEKNETRKNGKLIEILLSSSTSSLSLSEPSSNDGDQIAICNTSDENNSSDEEYVEDKKKHKKFIQIENKERDNRNDDIINEDISFDNNTSCFNNKASDISIINKTKKGSEWLKELDNTLNMTTCDVTLPNQTKKSPSTLLTVNNSTLFLTDNDLKKRKLKFIKYKKKNFMLILII